MALGINFSASQESPVSQFLKELANLDTHKMFDEIGAAMVASTQLRFVGQHDIDGNPWKASWRAQMQGGQTLRDTGRLMNGLTHKWIFIILIYGKRHQSSNGGLKMPSMIFDLINQEE